MFFDSVAFAMAPPAGGGDAGGLGGILGGPLPMLVLMFAIFYFLLIRPQQKKQKAHRAMLDALKKGDKVWTNGGILGTIVDIDGDNLTIEIATGVNVVIKRGFVADKDGGAPAADKKK
ncbi:MAG: preprotein translocase subunit YajC [Pseudodesulfovibrio sp.]|jgi:preprotein translocase subunit YajC|uniref:Sec translocon accessory complex subunit YajC n=1 Tax=Pseudodesulfovibrio indicus TaxID=1716143 RepID=A0A126QP00_9BACT|nr:preprotein translocase subunit YajC [Pseudodesulfovibrio indicus]AMK11773.1 preprotein translocase subunit YajC [Pseudodesulfovibrio indicus]TDT88312.1 protein translocase subunit yajC [Pseudodesulfovibrio indicus]